jgi:hypothetical protein
LFPYFLIAILLLFLALTEQLVPIKKNLFIPVLTGILLILFAGLRADDIDKDYENYLDAFNLVLNPSDYFKHFQDWIFFEPMYYLIPSFFKTYTSITYYTLFTFLLFAIAGVTIKFFAIARLTNLFFLALFCYFCHFYLLHEMTQIRQGIASGVLLLIIPLTMRRKYIRCVLLILVASLFHYSSLFLFLIFPLNKTDQKTKLYTIILVTTFVLAFVNTSFFMTVFQFNLGPLTVRTQAAVGFIEAGVFTEINKLNIFFLTNFFISAVFLYYSKLIQTQNSYAVLLIKLQILGLLFFQIFSAIPTIAFRINDLLGIVSIITLPFFTYIFKNRWIGISVTISISISFFLVNLYYGKLLNGYHLNALLNF